MTAHEPAARAGQPRARAGRWLAGRTLRGRLVAGLVALLALACATVGTLTYAHLHSVLMNNLNTELMAANRRYMQCLTTAPPGSQVQHGSQEGPPPPSPGQGPCAQLTQSAGTLNAVFSPVGVLTDAHMAYRDTCPLSSSDRTLLASVASRPPATSHPTSVDLSGYGEYQVVSGRLGSQIVVTGIPLSSVTTTVHEVALTEIAVFSVALALTGVLGAGWVRASLRPLRRVAATATRVALLPLAGGEVHLSERVPGADPRTEVGQVGAAFNRMLGHVESALARREASEARLRSFAADASHELRTPLAAIRGYSELARRSPDSPPPDIAHALDRIESESARMSVLVDELLLLAQLDAGRPLASEPVDLTRLAIDATSDARAAAPGHRWHLDLPDLPVVVAGDEHRLHQVLANLLSNAARHTPAGTVVAVAVSGTVATATISVTDNGPGIPAELQAAVFERFVRGDASRSRTGGSTGLGLSIVAAVTAAHGGHAEVASQPGETRFSITLPIPAGNA